MTAFARYYEDDEPIQDLYYYVKNAQGDITDITDDWGNIIASYAYDPWGKVLSVTGTNLEIANLNPFRYRSYYYDSDIEMYYLQSRYYDPEVGRFINCDDVRYIGATQTELSYNAFAYCENDPVNNSDPTGHSITLTAGATVTIYVLLKTSLVFIAGFLLLISADILWKNGFFDYLINTVQNYIDILRYTAKSAINELKNTLNESISKAKKKPKTWDRENHHIIPQKAVRAEPARRIWVEKMKYSINDPLNMIYLNYHLHRRIHTKKYYFAINEIICCAYRTKNLKEFLLHCN